MKKIVRILVCNWRSKYYSAKIDSGDGKIIFVEPFIRFRLIKQPDSKLIVNGIFSISPHLGGMDGIFINLGRNSNFQVNGDFSIGQGVKISLEPNSTLIIGGKDKESASGITANTIILVSKKIEIGKDFVCAWSVFITDSDWHQIKGQFHQADVKIGNHVWIANNCNVLKGAVIGNNCIVASNSKIINGNFPDNVLIGGSPSKILKVDIDWARDIDTFN